MADRTEQESIHKQYDTSTYEGRYDDIKRKFDSFDPTPINDACNTWSGVARRLGDLANNLRGGAGQPLSDAWDSPAAADAQHQLQVAQATASALADQCMQMARATDAAYQYANWYKTHFPGAGYLTLHDDHQRAVDHEVGLLERYNEVIGTLPDQVRAQFNPSIDDFVYPPSGRGGNTGGTHLPGSAGTHLPGSAGTHLPGSAGTHLPGAGGTHVPGGGSGGTPGGGAFPGGGSGGAGSPYDPGSLLAGGGGGAGGIGAGLGPDGLGAGGLGSGAGGIGSGLGSGAGGGVGSGPGGLGSGPGGFGSGAGSAGRGGRFGTGEPEGAGGRGAGSRSAAASAGAAPMHGGHGADEEERERSTWLTEDEDVWGGGTDAPPPVIGG
jgi:hypothetical protein